MPTHSNEDCYCVCHSSLSSRASCEHCKGVNQVSKAHSNEDELKQLEIDIVSEIENPTIKSQISTADIRVMGISSTGMSDRMFTIMKLIQANKERWQIEAEIKALKGIVQDFSPVMYAYDENTLISVNGRITELTKQLAQAKGTK